MARQSTRERQERFIQTFDGVPGHTLQDGVAAFVGRHGAAWLTDDQIAEVTARLVDKARFSQRLRVRNRRALQRSAA